MQALSEISDVRARLEILKRKVLEAETELKAVEEKDAPTTSPRSLMWRR